MDRLHLRQALRDRRQQLSLKARLDASTKVCERIKILGLIQPKQKVAMYKAYGEEVDLSPLINYAQQLEAEVYFPILPQSGRILSFSAFSTQGYWYKNRLGIEEWQGASTLPPTLLDLVFTPVLGFDKQANRLGQGGGYYDASFAFLQQTGCLKPQLFGVAFECQQVNYLAVEAWDVPLHAVITEKAYYVASQGK
jgi:5-formyltetrahydrofolate cyclo-ligase